MVCSDNEILLSCKKEWTLDTHYDMDVSQNNEAEGKQLDKREYILFVSVYIQF